MSSRGGQSIGAAGNLTGFRLPGKQRKPLGQAIYGRRQCDSAAYAADVLKARTVADRTADEGSGAYSDIVDTCITFDWKLWL